MKHSVDLPGAHSASAAALASEFGSAVDGTLASESGGQAYFIQRARELEGTFDSVLLDLRSQYVLSYEPPEGPEGLRRIRVEIEEGRYVVRCRRSYYYVPPE